MKEGTRSGLIHTEDNFFDYVDDIEDVMDSGRERVAAASDILEDWVLDKQVNLESWHQNRETKKLKKEAGKAQRYAEAAMEVALAALDEAEWALARALMVSNFADSSHKDNAA